eukprot:1977194-Pleurochrysis_carterae.AAC.1
MHARIHIAAHHASSVPFFFNDRRRVHSPPAKVNLHDELTRFLPFANGTMLAASSLLTLHTYPDIGHKYLSTLLSTCSNAPAQRCADALARTADAALARG